VHQQRALLLYLKVTKCFPHNKPSRQGTE